MVWQRQFEIVVSLENTLRKTIGDGLLFWSELEEVLVDVEVTLRTIPLS